MHSKNNDPLEPVRSALRAYRSWREATGREPSRFWVAQVAEEVRQHGAPSGSRLPARQRAVDPGHEPPSRAAASVPGRSLSPDEIEERKARFRAAAAAGRRAENDRG